MLGIHLRRALVALTVCLAAAASLAVAQDAKAERKKVELPGKLACIGCHLEKSHGAEAQCTLHAKHAQGFIADDGTIYTILDNGRGHLLITEKKLTGAAIKLEGYVFPKAQVIEVIRYARKDGEKWVQHDYCKQCGFEPGDNKGKDLCADCEK